MMSFEYETLLNEFLNSQLYDLNEINYNIYRSGNRIIYVPCKKLMKVQRLLKNFINSKYPLKLSAFDSAKVHARQKWILKMDIKNFYESVLYCDIEKVIKNTFSYMETSINYLTDIVTVGKRLPTGAPTSAHIANAVFSTIDRRIRDYCSMREINYSRYMDDMTFSCSDKSVLNSVEDFVADVIKIRGFRLNDTKTKYISNNKQQKILGIVVNKEVRVPKSLRRKIRAMIHRYALSLGEYSPLDYKYKQFEETELEKLFGYMNYIKSVDKKTYKQLVSYARKFRSIDI